MTHALLIEDSATIRDSLIPSLSELADVDVLAFAETEREALSLVNARGGEAQLLILDLFLREGSGFGVLAKRLVGLPPFTVVLSNHATDDMRRRCKVLGASAVYDKSTELEQFFDYCRAIPEPDLDAVEV